MSYHDQISIHTAGEFALLLTKLINSRLNDKQIKQEFDKLKAIPNLELFDVDTYLDNVILKYCSNSLSNKELKSIDGLCNYNKTEAFKHDSYSMKPGDCNHEQTMYNEFIYILGKPDNITYSSDPYPHYPIGSNMDINGPKREGTTGDYRSIHIYKTVVPVTNSSGVVTYLDTKTSQDSECLNKYSTDAHWRNDVYGLFSTATNPVPDKLTDISSINHVITHSTTTIDHTILDNYYFDFLYLAADQIYNHAANIFHLSFNYSGVSYYNQNTVVYHPYNNFIHNITDGMLFPDYDIGRDVMEPVYASLSNGVEGIVDLFLNSTGYNATITPSKSETVCNIFPSNPITPSNSISPGIRLNLNSTFLTGEDFKHQIPQFIVDGFKFTDAPYSLKNLNYHHAHKPGYFSGDYIVFNSNIFSDVQKQASFTNPKAIVANYVIDLDGHVSVVGNPSNDGFTLNQGQLIANLLWENKNPLETLTLNNAGDYFLFDKQITLHSNRDSLLVVTYQKGNAYILGGHDYLGKDGSDSPDRILSSSELNLIAVLYNVYEGNMSPDNPNSMHLNPDYSQIKFVGDILGYNITTV